MVVIRCSLLYSARVAANARYPNKYMVVRGKGRAELWCIDGCNTLYDAWTRVIKAFQPSSRQCMVTLISTLFQLHLEDSQNIEVHLKAFETICNSLEIAKVSLPEGIKSSVPPCYPPRVMECVCHCA